MTSRVLFFIQEKRNEINAALPDKEEYPARRFNTTMFAQLENSTCEHFLTEVNNSKSGWIRSPETFNSANEIGDLVKLYTYFASNRDWSKAQDRHTNMVAMATELYKEQQKNRGRTPPQGPNPKETSRRRESRWDYPLWPTKTRFAGGGTHAD